MNRKHQWFTLTILLIVLALSLSCQTVSAPAGDQAPVEPEEVEEPIVEAVTEEPMVAPSPEPEETEAPAPVEEEPSCYKWNQVTLDMAGEVVCVYGVAYSHSGQKRIDFSPEKNSFFLIDPTYYYPDLKEGVCMVANERVEIFDGKIPFMTIKNGLYYCEPWMEE
jgi:hypothetical protein